MSQGLPTPIPPPPLHPHTKPKFEGTGAGSLRSSRFGPSNAPIEPPKARPILVKGAVPPPILSQGIGRYTCLLQRLTLCRTAGKCSLGINLWINTMLQDFAARNPQVAVYVKDVPRYVKVYGDFAGGKNRQFDVHMFNEHQVDKVIHRLLYMNGQKEQIQTFRKHTVHPSIQGYWHPFLNKPWRKLTEVDTPNLKTENELLQRRLIQPKVVETSV